MKQQPLPHRPAIALLMAATALPFTPALAQDPPVLNVPPPVMTPAPAPVTAPAPPPIMTPPPPVVAPAPSPPAATREAPEEPPAARSTRTTSSTARRAPRPAQPRAEQAARPAAATPAPAPAEPIAAPVTEPVAPAAQAPVAQAPIPAPVSEPAPAQDQWNLASLWPWLLAGTLLVIGAILLFGRRRRADEDVVHEEYRAEPTFAAREPIREAPAAVPEPELAYLTPAAAAAAAPLAADPVAGTRFDENEVDATPALDKVSVGEPASADVDALAAASEPEAGRPWIEFLMRPLRAGTTTDDAVVEFELTVGNTGSVSAKESVSRPGCSPPAPPRNWRWSGC